MKTDYLGNELKVGDTVVFMQIGYRGLMKGIITKLSDKKATIAHDMTNTCSTESMQFHDQMIKINTSENEEY
jgi:phage gp45-like